MTRQLCFKFIFVFGFLHFVPKVHCDGGESHNTNVLERALEKQTKATEEMFEIKLDQQKNDFVQLLDAKMEQYMDKCNQKMNVKSCPTNWNKVLDSCILLSSEEADFDTAIEKCKDLDAKLYEPQSLSHNQMVYALIEEKGLEAKHFWVGIHDKNAENSFVYQSNNQPIAFEHWGSFNDENGAQPNNKGGHQDCVEMRGANVNWNGPKGSWNDNFCSTTYRFICEK